MNLSDEDSTTLQPFDVTVTHQPSNSKFTIYTLSDIIIYFYLALGLPGNTLSAIIWLKRQVASKNSSAVYLAVLAINDLINLLFVLVLKLTVKAIQRIAWLYYCMVTLHGTTYVLETLLVLGFSIERLVAISCPLRVRFIQRLYATC